MEKIENFLLKHWITLIIVVFGLVAFVFYFNKAEITLNFFDKHSSGITAISALLVLISGSSWLDTSKRKMRGKLDYDIARRYLKSVLQLRDAVKTVRNPFIPIGEIHNALEKNGFLTEEANNAEKINRSVYSLRWNKVQEAWTNFEEVLTEAEISWGGQAVKIQNDLDQLIRKLRSVVWLFVNYPEDFHKKGDENRKLLYGTHDENDEFAKEINIEIEKITSFLKSYL